MLTFLIYNLKFIKIERDKSNYYLGEYSPEYERVFMPH